MLKRAEEDSKASEIIEKKRAEGVQDEDVRWWWSMHDLERRMLVVLDEAWRLDAFMNLRDQGNSQEEAAQRVRTSFPIYGGPSDTTHTSDGDRPLPWELKDRTDKWVQQFAARPEAMQARLAWSSSMNAINRQELRSGNI